MSSDGGMDETLQQMQLFYGELREFNQSLLASIGDLARRHEAVDPLWQDSFRREYDAEWQSFVETMSRYLNREAFMYADFLDRKIRELRGYLHGGR